MNGKHVKSGGLADRFREWKRNFFLGMNPYTKELEEIKRPERKGIQALLYEPIKKPPGPRYLESPPGEPYRETDKWRDAWKAAGNPPVNELIESDGYLYPSSYLENRPPSGGQAAGEPEIAHDGRKPSLTTLPGGAHYGVKERQNGPRPAAPPNRSQNGVKPATSEPRPAAPPLQHKQEQRIFSRLESPTIEIKGKTFPVHSIAFNGDGKVDYVSYLDDGNAKVIFERTGKSVITIKFKGERRE